MVLRNKKHKEAIHLNSKAIKSILSKKHNEFCASIEDENVRKLISKNSIITGGSIVSLLTGETVNDFDYYFTNFETAQAVANYYVAVFNKEHDGIVAEVKVENDAEPARIRIFVQSAGVAGEVPENDVDLSAFDIDDSKQSEKNEPEKSKKYHPVWLSSNAITLSNKIQLVIRFYGEPSEIHKNYDFIHCTCYWTSADNKLELPAKALESIINKQLYYVGSKYPLCSIIRSRKFIERGWKINAGQYLKMALQLNQLNLLDIKTLEDQLVGVDSAYFSQVIGSIKERQENDSSFKFDAAYLVEIIDRIF